MATLPRLWLRASGNARLGLVRDPRYVDRMAPVLKSVDNRGTEYVIQLNHQEVANLGADAAKLYTADQEQVSEWWESLADASDSRFTPAGGAHVPARCHGGLSGAHSGGNGHVNARAATSHPPGRAADHIARRGTARISAPARCGMHHGARGIRRREPRRR